jgi:hypothetical protein
MELEKSCKSAVLTLSNPASLGTQGSPKATVTTEFWSKIRPTKRPMLLPFLKCQHCKEL